MNEQINNEITKTPKSKKNKVKREKEENVRRISKDAALREVKTVIQIIHHYRDEYVGNTTCPSDRVAIFDESQRAWTKDEISSFMARKKGVRNFDYSEPEFLIQTMDRHDDWAVIVCLVGGGQEINTGEAGISEWIKALNEQFPHWNVYISPKLTEPEYAEGRVNELLQNNPNVTYNDSLHLGVSLRSYRAEKLSAFVHSLLSFDANAATLYNEIKDKCCDYGVWDGVCPDLALPEVRKIFADFC